MLSHEESANYGKFVFIGKYPANFLTSKSYSRESAQLHPAREKGEIATSSVRTVTLILDHQPQMRSVMSNGLR